MGKQWTYIKGWIEVTPFKIGIIITILFISVTYNYFESQNDFRHEKSMTDEIIELAHQKSIDFRLKQRGERAPSEDIALIVIDDKSLETIGRWPWPRDVISRMIEILMDNDARMVGFDAVFSEPDKNSTLELIEKIQNRSPSSIAVKNLIENERTVADKDFILSKTIKKYSDRLVMGMYWDEQVQSLLPVENFCRNIAILESGEIRHLENEEFNTVALDQQVTEIPMELEDILITRLESIKLNVSSSLSKDKTIKTQNQLRQEILNSQYEYCNKWLSEDDSDLAKYQGIWKEIQSGYEELKSLSLESFVKNWNQKGTHVMVKSVGRVWSNVPEMAAATKHTGYFNAQLDEDGTIRRAPLFVRRGTTLLPSLPFKMYQVYKGKGAVANIANDLAYKRKIISSFELLRNEDEKTTKIPVNESGELLINYAGKQKMFPHLSIAELFNDKKTVVIDVKEPEGKTSKLTVNKKAFIKDKIFIFGPTAIGIFDMRVTPFEENYPGLETHANVLDNLIRADFFYKHPDEESYMLIGMLIAGLFLSFLMGRLGALPVIGITLSSLGLIYLVDRYYFFENGIVITVVLPVLLVVLLSFSITSFKYFTEERKKKELKGTFQKYVSPSIVNEILKDPENLELGGKKEHMTVLFSDVRGFTTISENLDPQKLSELLNRYLTPMTQIVFENKGTLDKYMGDAIMAFFGAPVKYDNHAEMACLCALEMMEKLKELKETFKKEGLPVIDIGIGINTGEMSVGNMGSDIVRSYTVMGDAVNLGSRLEGINKQYGTQIIISEFTRKELGPSYMVREIDWVRVKGKSEPVRIFELVGKKDERKDMDNVIDMFERGFELYHKKDFKKALEYFEKSKQLKPGDQTSELYLKRCANYLDEAPPKDWDGVFEMKTK